MPFATIENEKVVAVTETETTCVPAPDAVSVGWQLSRGGTFSAPAPHGPWETKVLDGKLSVEARRYNGKGGEPSGANTKVVDGGEVWIPTKDGGYEAVRDGDWIVRPRPDDAAACRDLADGFILLSAEAAAARLSDRAGG